MVSVVVAAHNEGSVVGATLDALIGGTRETLEVVVVVNGSTDDTAVVARSRAGVKVLELAEGSKPLALNVGDAEAVSFPRVYLDADILIPEGGLDAVVATLASGVLAAVPERNLDTTGRPWPVRAYFAISQRLPAFRDGLFGRGMIALSAEGRARFETFPMMVADDLFLDGLFARDEKTLVSQVEVVVGTPHTTQDLIHRLVRVRRGNAAMRKAAAQGIVEARVRRSDRWAWLHVVAGEPKLAFAGIAYLALTLLAAVRARRGPVSDMTWGRNKSTRR